MSRQRAHPLGALYRALPRYVQTAAHVSLWAYVTLDNHALLFTAQRLLSLRAMNTSSLSTLLLRAETPSVLTVPTDLGALPCLLRVALADIVVQAQAGERAALASAKRIVSLETDDEARAFARTQVRDEESHLRFFNCVVDELNVSRPVLPSVERLFAAAHRERELPYVLLTNNLIVETLAHDLFGEVGRQFSALARAWWCPKSWRAAFSRLSEQFQAVRQDESRHVALGVLRLRSLRDQMSATERRDFDERARFWVRELERALADAPVLFFLAPVKRAVIRSVVGRAQTRCLDVGVEVRS